MRLIVMGQQAFGKDALAKILEAGKDEVVAVYCEPDKSNVDPIKEFALETCKNEVLRRRSDDYGFCEYFCTGSGKRYSKARFYLLSSVIAAIAPWSVGG